MRSAAMTVLVLAALGMPSAAQAAAPTYPWCAHYMMPNAPHNCGFVTFQQCLAAVSGNGGTCQMNPFYNATSATPRSARRKQGRV